MQGSDKGHDATGLIGNARTFMGAGIGFRLLVAGGCLILLWLCVGWAVST